MYGFFGKLLVIDLDSNSCKYLPLEDDVLRTCLGGRGLAAHLLLSQNPRNVAPLSPGNMLIFATGPVAGSPVWGSCRHGIFTKSPQTGFFSESYAGGTVAQYMSGTGLDAVCIKGRSDTPVWLEISDKGTHFHPAEDLRGKDTFGTEDHVKAWIKENRTEAGKCGVVCIGPAGEKQVVFSVIENDYWRSAGRTGTGAVLGSKNIKAIAFHGKKKREFADPDLLKKFSTTMAAESKDNPGVKAYKSLGTPMLVDIMNDAGGFPSRYWHKGRSDHKEGINAKALHDRCRVTPHACLKCFMACGRLSTVKEGRHKGLKVEGPEYETIYAFGGLCEVADIEEIVYLNDLCDRLGLDTMTAGNLAGLTIEAVRQGKIEYNIDYGDVDSICRLIQDIADRKGLGDTLARGIRFAAGEWNMEAEAIHVKGLEPAGYDPRILKGMGLAYGTSPRGACHLRATFYKPELSGIVDPEKIEGKAEIFAEWEDRLALFDTLIVCRFYRDLYQWEQLAEIIKGSTGLDLNIEKMRLIASENTDNIRRFNIREGLTVEDDKLPVRFNTEALPETGMTISEQQMSQLLKDYYRSRGWNKRGEPGRKTEIR